MGGGQPQPGHGFTKETPPSAAHWEPRSVQCGTCLKAHFCSVSIVLAASPLAGMTHKCQSHRWVYNQSPSLHSEKHLYQQIEDLSKSSCHCSWFFYLTVQLAA